MLKPIYTKRFLKDLDLAEKRNKKIEKLTAVIRLLSEEKTLDRKYKDHSLQGNYKDCRECHIEPDWLLIYQEAKTELILLRTGSHSDLF